MAVVRPFSALRPRPELASRIASVPYDVVNADEARALAGDPASFLHVSRAEIDLPPDTNPYADAVYARAVANFEGLKRSSLVQEPQPAVYLYRLRMGHHEQTGIAAGFSVDEYDRGLIKKHEKTRPDKENDRTRHIIETRAQSGPVLLTFRDSDALARARVAGHDLRAALRFHGRRWHPAHDLEDRARSRRGDRVGVWRCAGAVYRGRASSRGERRAGARAFRADAGRQRGRRSGAGSLRGSSAPIGEHAWFLAVAFPEKQTQILPYHRVMKDLARP